MREKKDREGKKTCTVHHLLMQKPAGLRAIHGGKFILSWILFLKCQVRLSLKPTHPLVLLTKNTEKRQIIYAVKVHGSLLLMG